MQYTMKTILIILALSVLAIPGFSQEEKVYTKKELRKIAKEERKAQREAEEAAMRELTEIMLSNHRFVLEADYVGDNKGARIPVNSTINFIAVDSNKAVLQLGTTYGMGYNGVGGITVDGNVTKYELKVIEGKKSKSYNLLIIVMTSLGTYDISFMLNDRGYGDATVRGNTMGQLRYSGNLVPLDISRVYKGTSIY
jgi:hypothetical protein